MRRLTALLACALAVAGCAGADVGITAQQSRYAISMSRSIRDQGGVLYDDRSLERVGILYADRTRVGFLYSLLTPFSTFDISDDVNAQVAAVGGEAVIGLTVSVSDACDILNNFPILNILPVWPGCVPVTVTGDIVRRRPVTGS